MVVVVVVVVVVAVVVVVVVVVVVYAKAALPGGAPARRPGPMVQRSAPSCSTNII